MGTSSSPSSAGTAHAAAQSRPPHAQPLAASLPLQLRHHRRRRCAFTGQEPRRRGEENFHRIAEILSHGRNPMLIDIGAASTTAEFASTSYHIIHVEPNSIDKSDLDMAVAMAKPPLG
ncbi:hypothetical protein E2562_035696 [Oryza meyeriana var. granulata]|uniref:Uncharacterized protein n=1 Tax=Oryza meyeriana var. granulata TaxID=110450 RepID=A0A6G1E710_9ORYZ|nr:hypothetical protein E2562_035696 [Oryza meyeriana var. granulata]